VRIAVRELLRRPGRFVPVVAALSLLVLLLIVLGGFLDGLTLDQTGALRAQGDVAFVSSDDAELLPAASRVSTDVADDVADVPAVAAVGRVSSVPTTAEVVGDDRTVDVVAYGYDRASGRLPAPPSAGGAVVDRRLADLVPVAVGDALRLGPEARQVTVAAVVDDASAGAPTVWLSTAPWRELVAEAAPADPLARDGAQLLAVAPAGDTTVAEVVAAVGDRVDGVAVGTTEDVIAALPAVSQQAATFQGIIGVTFVVTLIVVALFFVLLTLERLRLYAVLKALGGRTGDLLAGLAVQAVGIAVAALVIGGLLAVALTVALPPDLPVRVLPARVAVLAAGTTATALIGALGTLRRLLRIDPARAIG
jgi:putative ABC transport system permease protein